MQRKSQMKSLILFISFAFLCGIVYTDQSQPLIPSVTSSQVILAVGQIFPGQIKTGQTNQAIHYLHINQIEKKFLYIRLSTFDKVRIAIGLYLNESRSIVHACQDNIFDSCYIPANLLKPNTDYAILIVVNENIKYNLYTYWGDLEHIQPNQQIKFMFDNTNPTQLFHLQFDQVKQFQQIRMILKPQTTRTKGDNLKIFANIGFKQQPTVQKHQYQSVYVWNDAQAIILNKQQVKQQKGIGIYIVGNAQAVYIFQCQFITQTSHKLKIGQILNDYLPKYKSTSYQLDVADSSNVNSFVIKISAFTGQIMVAFYYDKQFKKLLEKNPFQYMSDQQFIFKRQDFAKDTMEIYMKVTSVDAYAIYQINPQVHNNQLASQITQNVYQFKLMSQPRQALYFYSHVWDSNQFESTQNYKFDISMIKIFGYPEVTYYYCKPNSDQKKCKDIYNNDFPQYVTKINPFGVQQIGTKLITTLNLDQSAYKTVNNVEKKLMIIIVIQKKGTQDSVAWALQYSNPHQIRLLRQGRAFEDKVRYLQKRYYKYINNNLQVSQIRIHINQISGLTKIRSKRTPFEKQGPQSTLDKKYPDTIVIKDHITDPIYLEVQGVVTSLYILSVTAVHSEHLISNALIMAEDLQYQVKLLPYQHMNIQIHPIQSDIVFQFYSEGGSVMVCQVDAKDLCIKDKVFGSHGKVSLDASMSRQIRLRIGNSFQSKLQANPSVKDLPQTINNVKLTLIYHGQRARHCDQRRINKIYSQNIKKGDCFKFHLPITAGVQIMAIRSDLGQHNNIFILCSSKVVPNLVNDRYVIKQDLIKQHCKQAQNQMILQMIITENSQQLTGQLKMDYSVQYKDDTVTLADGIAYLARGYSTMQGALRTFFYQILDEDRDVNIVLYNKKGLQKFLIKIANKAERYMVASQADSKFSSKNSDFYMNPNTKISPKDISDANCGRTCVLVISVYSSETAGNQVQYALQITQNHIFLKQGQITTDFLPKGSSRFYEYQSKSASGSLVLTISDNNRKCARTLMSEKPFPTNSNYFLKQNQGTIIYQKKNQGTYYFAIQAIDDCQYTVSVSEGKGKATKIQYGQFFDIGLEQGQVKWFYIRHNTNSTFKVVTLKNYGQMKIYANQTDLSKDALSNIQGNKFNLQKFAFKSTYQNTLAVDFVAKQYCFNCYYFICVKAIKKTEASIFIGGSSSKIALSQDKILFDTIQSKNGLTFANFYRISDGKMQIKVHSGKINLFMSYSNQKFEKTFEQSRKVYQQTYNFTRQEGIWSPLQIRITAEQAPASYSLEISSLKQHQIFERKVNPGEHTYLFLGQGQQHCFTGSLIRNQQQIFLSTDTSQKLKLNNLNIIVKLDENVTQSYQKQIVGNILSIRFNFENSLIHKAKKYEICARTQSKNDSLALFVFQNIDINLIHSDNQVLVRKQSKFLIIPRSDIILDLFQCKGTAQIYYGNQIDKIRQKQSSKLDTLGIPGQSHAIRISELSTVYVDIVAEMATVLWMPLKEKQERGVGYFRYAIGNLQFTSQFNNIQFRIGGLYKIKQTSTKPVQVKYTLYVSNSKQLLQQAVMCEKIPLNKLLSSTLTNPIVGNNSHFAITMHMDKKRITDKFSENETLYYNVVADLTLEPPNNKDEEDHQHYRFIYFQQVVPSEVFRQNKIQTIQITLLIVLVVVSVIGLILISCIFVKCIVPALGKLKNRVLVQQKQDPKDKSIPVPQSSDRNQIGPTSTQDQIN